MPSFLRKTSHRTSPDSCDSVLQRYYDRLNSWAITLAQGDRGRAHDLVHDLWVHITLTQPDLTHIENLDGYLYRCMRHLYLSQLARASRDALQSLDPFDFDSLQIASWAGPRVETLAMQNDLRRICCYVAWRKGVAKSASYFILRFLHGYHLHEIANLSGLPLATVHPKLSQIRAEIRTHLQASTKLHFPSRKNAPIPSLSWKVVSSPLLFAELRKNLLDAPSSGCLPKRELLAHYEDGSREPLSCGTLAHVVSCERCLDVINSRFGMPDLRDREPLDGLDPGSSPHQGVPVREGSVDSLLRIVRRRFDDIHHHHPEQLFIAVNGKIIASHMVNSSDNKLSARVERTESVEFVEVFGQQGLRLAFLSIDALPPDGPHEQIQHVELSDKRHLTLKLAFDGLGMYTEVSYTVPYLGFERVEAQYVDSPVAGKKRASIWRLPRFEFEGFFRFPHLVAAVCCLVAICLFGLTRYRAEPNAVIKSQAQTVTLQKRLQSSGSLAPGLTEHRVVRYEKSEIDGRRVQRGTVEVWRDADSRRWSRDFYDESHRVIAAESYNNANSDRAKGTQSDKDWTSEITSETLSHIPAEDLSIQPAGDGYTVKLSAAALRKNVTSAVLVLDAEFFPIQEDLRIENRSESYELKFVRTTFERKPTVSVPDRAFQLNPADLTGRSRPGLEAKPRSLNADLAEAYIAVLSQVREVASDRSEPIDVIRTEREIRITGQISSDLQKNYILARLRTIPNQHLLRIHLGSPTDLLSRSRQGVSQHPPVLQTYDMAEGKILMDTSLRRYFVSHGTATHNLDASVSRFSQEAIARGQRLLRDAFAVRELCNGVSSEELVQVHEPAKRQWTAMLLRRVTAMNEDLTELDDQLRPLLPLGTPAPTDSPIAVLDRDTMIQQSDDLLREMQLLNKMVGEAFAYTQAQADPIAPDLLVGRIVTQIPLARTQGMVALAHQLSASINKNSGNPLTGSLPPQP